MSIEKSFIRTILNFNEKVIDLFANIKSRRTEYLYTEKIYLKEKKINQMNSEKN